MADLLIALMTWPCKMHINENVPAHIKCELVTKYSAIVCGISRSSLFTKVPVWGTSENADIFTAQDEIYLVFTKKNVNFLFILNSTENTESTTYIFHWSFLVRLDFFQCVYWVVNEVWLKIIF